MRVALLLVLVLVGVAPAEVTYTFENQTEALLYVEQEESYFFPVPPNSTEHREVTEPVSGFGIDGTFVPLGVVRQVTLTSGTVVQVDTTVPLRVTVRPDGS